MRSQLKAGLFAYPLHITEKLNRIKKAQRKISQCAGRTATVEEIAQELASDS
ncbi:MAG UNVERIFIED_CONTAM: hypothetical protein LVR29_06580 [Microcystis novacekii LVE1205-3]